MQGEYNFRVHADYGMGAFIGVDGAEHTPGNTWGHLQLNAGSLAVGSHEFEALGFEDCCDGHAELEVHLTCDAAHADTAWRVVTAGASDCLKCDEDAHLEAQYKFAGNADDEGGGHHGRLTGYGNVGGEYTAGHAGGANEALYFDQSATQYVTVTTPFSASNSDFTIAIWLKPDIEEHGDNAWHGFIGHQKGAPTACARCWRPFFFFPLVPRRAHPMAVARRWHALAGSVGVQE